VKWNTVNSGQRRSTGGDLRKAAIRQIGVQSAGNPQEEEAEPPGNMAAVGFRKWAQALCKGKGPGISGLLSATRAASQVSKDMLPSTYPHTDAERAAAAKKYSMRIEDYEPYPDQGDGYGDYPKLPDKSQAEGDPWYTWDHPDLRRNWGEPMHWDFDMYTRNRVDTSAAPVDFGKGFKQLAGFLGFMLFMFYLGEQFPSYQPVAPKQFPFHNLHVERGGDPDKLPKEVKHYEI